MSDPPQRATDGGGSPPAKVLGAPWAELAVDRDAEVPIGVQLAWAVRSRIDDGRLARGARLPGLRDLAESLQINANTVRAVYARLEHDGLLETRHGRGTFVAATASGSPQASAIATRAARDAIKAGVDPRDIARALYVEGGRPDPDKDQAGRRATLRAQIAALEQALSELVTGHPALVRRSRRSQPAPSPSTPMGAARLLSVAELEQAKTRLLQRLGAMQASIEALEREIPADDTSQAAADVETQAVPSARRKSGRRAASRAAPAGA